MQPLIVGQFKRTSYLYMDGIRRDARIFLRIYGIGLEECARFFGEHLDLKYHKRFLNMGHEHQSHHVLSRCSTIMELGHLSFLKVPPAVQEIYNKLVTIIRGGE